MNGVAQQERSAKRTALLAAVEKHKIQCAIALLKLGADPNWVIPNDDPYEPGETALNLAARNGDQKLVLALILAGAKPNYERRGGGAALACAAAQGHLAVVRCLLKHGASVVSYVLDGAVRTGHTKVVDAMLRASANPNRPDPVRDSLLSLAASNGHLSIIKLLLKHGARIDHSQNGLTPLVQAIINRQTEVALFLIRAGANIEARDNGGRTPVLFAAKNREPRVAKKLIERGADITVKDPKGASVHDLAKQSKDRQMIALLSFEVSRRSRPE